MLPKARGSCSFTTSLATCSVLFLSSVHGASATFRIKLGTCRALSCFRIASRTPNVATRAMQWSTSGKPLSTPYTSAALNLMSLKFISLGSAKD